MIATFFVAPICFVVGAGFAGVVVAISWNSTIWLGVDHTNFLLRGLAFLSTCAAGLAGGIFAAIIGFRWFLKFMEDH